MPISLAAAALLLALAMPCVSMAQSPQTAPVYPARWEYRVVPLNSIDGTNQPFGSGQNGTNFTKPFEDGLAKFGNEGWELVSIDLLQSNKVAIFKRPSAASSR